jgi:ribosomal protection tetracycline resistance protein
LQPTEHHLFATPTLETIVLPRNNIDKGRLRTALDQLTEQDPLINLRQDNTRQEMYVSLYGEVQKQVIQATLANDFGIDVEFRETTPICIERPAGTGSAVVLLQEEVNPTSATVGLHVEPGPIGSGLQFRLNVTPRQIPLYIYKTTNNFIEHVTEYIRGTLQEGLFGWQVTDCIVTMYECNYYIGDGPSKPYSDTPRTIASDFRKLTPVVLMLALKQARTMVYEPMNHFELDAPQSVLAQIMQALVNVEAKLIRPPSTQAELVHLEGLIPARRTFEFERMIPDLTNGEGTLITEFGEYQKVSGKIPGRCNKGE